MIVDNSDLIRRLRLEPQPHQFQSLTRLYQHLVDERSEAAEALEKIQGPLPENLKPVTTVECALVAEITRLNEVLKAERTKSEGLLRERNQAWADIRHFNASIVPRR